MDRIEAERREHLPADALAARQLWRDRRLMALSTHYMDEAERCHRIAILDHGALVADGTPDELTTALEGRTVLVDAAEPRQAQKALVDVPGVLSVAQIGNKIGRAHV